METKVFDEIFNSLNLEWGNEEIISANVAKVINDVFGEHWNTAESQLKKNLIEVVCATIKITDDVSGNSGHDSDYEAGKEEGYDEAVADLAGG